MSAPYPQSSAKDHRRAFVLWLMTAVAFVLVVVYPDGFDKGLVLGLIIAAAVNGLMP